MRQLKSINSFLYIQDDAIFIIPTKDFLIQMTINELTTFTLDKIGSNHTQYRSIVQE